ISENRCLTLSGSIGQCIRAQECPFVNQLLNVYGRSIPDYFRSQLRQMTCNGGRGVSGAYVCCQINTLVPQVQTKTQSTDINRIDQQGLRLLNSITQCGNQGNPKVSGGRPARQGSFPWMALLKYDIDDPRPFRCSGSLITENHILTAAHCIVQQPDVIAVRMGEHDLETERDCAVLGGTKVVCQEYEDYEVEDIRVHPNYVHGQINYDIAVIKVKGIIRPKSHIKPICLPIEEKSQELSYNQDFYIAGWGRTDKTDEPSVLQKAIIQRKGLDECRQFYGNDEVNDNHICATGSELKHTCQGDSGGPVFIKHRFKNSFRFVQYGIVSFGEKRCGQNQNQPGLFANVLDMLPWITQNLQ
ncbi:hypothetical protein KR067_005432, partial [Drosophila pandora]